MVNQNVARGAFLAAVALFFATVAMRYPIGDLSRPGPGLFPLITSGLLLLLGLLTLVQARFLPAERLDFDIRNIGLIMLALTSFVVASKLVSMLLGIVLMVFFAGFAATTYSWKRNVLVALGLIVIAAAFQSLLGLNLGLY